MVYHNHQSHVKEIQSLIMYNDVYSMDDQLLINLYQMLLSNHIISQNAIHDSILFYIFYHNVLKILSTFVLFVYHIHYQDKIHVNIYKT